MTPNMANLVGVVRDCEVLLKETLARRCHKPVAWVDRLILRGLSARRIGVLTFISGTAFNRYVQSQLNPPVTGDTTP